MKNNIVHIIASVLVKLVLKNKVRKPLIVLVKKLISIKFMIILSKVVENW